LPKVEADSQLIEQVLNELLGNAVKYRHPERVPLVELKAGLDGSGGWWLSVSDNGRGLPEMGRQHLFEAFARLDPDNPSSAGLGLAVCREVAEMHGGTIDAESLDEGSLFILRVPGVSRAGLAA